MLGIGIKIILKVLIIIVNEKYYEDKTYENQSMNLGQLSKQLEVKVNISFLNLEIMLLKITRE